LRVKDLDFAQRQIVVRDAKGRESRVTMLPDSLVEPLTQHLLWVKRIHQQDLEQGYGSVYLPYALERKYPKAEQNGSGSMCFLPILARLIRVVEFAVAIICMKVVCRRH